MASKTPRGAMRTNEQRGRKESTRECSRGGKRE
jgi:hypothetical protein